MEEDDNSMDSSEEESTKDIKGPNWSEMSTAGLPKAGGISTNYSQQSSISSFKAQQA